jgi:hypothetical protein
MARNSASTLEAAPILEEGVGKVTSLTPGTES